jgi:hypothetical protein
MELSELKSLWNTHHTQSSNQITLNKKLLKESSVNRIKSSLGEFKFENYLELILSVLFVPYIAGFIMDYGNSLTLLLPASIVLLVTIATIIWNIHNLYNAISLNYDESITQLHKKITRLQLWAKYELNALYLLMPILGYCFLVLFAKSVFNIDMYDYLNMYWLYNGVAVIAITVLIVWILKKFPDKKLEQAATFLKEIEAFENEN